MKLAIIFALICPLIAARPDCDSDDPFDGKEISIEDAVRTSDVVFRGVSTPPPPPSVAWTRFDLSAVYKGEKWLDKAGEFRTVNVTLDGSGLRCLLTGERAVPRDYVVFADVTTDDGIRAASAVIWNDGTDSRVWKALGWSDWSDWSSCSVSCSSGIQQRTRRCSREECPGFNVQQRPCNLFSCNATVTPLALKEGKFFHPPGERWEAVPDRPTAWRLSPDSYVWIPAAVLFPDVVVVPREFSLALTLRVPDTTLGTVFSLRSRSRQRVYLSLEAAGADLKLIHASETGTDVVRIPIGLDDAKWHQVAFSIRDERILDVFVDCEWSRTEILLAHTLDVPDDCDIIVGYLFRGDIEQLSIVLDTRAARLQCLGPLVAIDDPDARFTGTPASRPIVKSRKHRIK